MKKRHELMSRGTLKIYQILIFREAMIPRTIENDPMGRSRREGCKIRLKLIYRCFK